MTYRFKSSIRPGDMWLLSMYHTYHSIIGVVNVVFFVAMAALMWRFFYEVNDFVQVLLFLGVLIMPVLHPLAVWMKARAQVYAYPQNVELAFDDEGIHVTMGQEYELVRWKRIRGVKKEFNMLVLFMDGGRGYMLTKRVLKKQLDEVYDYLGQHVYE